MTAAGRNATGAPGTKTANFNFGNRLFALPAVTAALGILFLGLFAPAAKAQFTFASAESLTGDWGVVTNSNIGVTPDGGPNIAGFAPNAPLWYTWTAPQSGEVELDTIGSVATFVSTNVIAKTNIVVVTNTLPLDTVLAVFTGNSIGGLSQVAANDDLFPINSSSDESSAEQASITEFTISDSGDYANPNSRGVSQFDYAQPYYGPSHLRFNVTAGTTYYIAVDTKPNSAFPFNAVQFNSMQSYFPSTGQVSLQWAYQSSGVFRFATEDFDKSSGLPLYQTAMTESDPPEGNGAGDENSVALTYYPYNAPGVLVTVTRVAGSSGRCTVNYSTVNGTNLAPLLSSLPTNDVPAEPYVDYMPVNGTLVFDDYEMSKTILVPILNNGDYGMHNSGGSTNNMYFGIVLTNAQLDPNETADVSQPRVDPIFGTAMVKILNTYADPYGPDYVPVVVTNGTMVETNMVLAQIPTNTIFNFEKANYRIPEDVDTADQDSWAHVAIYVKRSDTNGAAETLNYQVNNHLDGDNLDGDEEENIFYPLQPGSDYAVPTPPTAPGIRGQNSDFPLVEGTISFPAEPAQGADEQAITFTITNSSLTKFNKDFKIYLYQQVTYNNSSIPVLDGMVAQTTVTILYNDQNPPAGSVDELYNADFNNLLALPPDEVPQTIPQRDPNPGVSGVVYSVAMLTNNEALIAGDFVSYNGFTLYQNNSPINNIALINTNGALDQSFSPNSGADGTINSVVVTRGGQYIIGGNFVSFNGESQAYVARLNANGSLDSSFNPVVNGPVQAVTLQPDGKILIGGAFTQVDSQSINGVARLNANGSLDSTFNPGTALNGTVNAIALISGIYTNVVSNSTTQESDTVFNTGNGAVGLATVKYNFPQQNEMQVYNGANLIFDTGVTTGQSQFSVQFGPGASPLVMVVNPGGVQSSTNWNYSATVATNSAIMVGGNFTVSGQNFANVARLTTNGLIDPTFDNIFAGADNSVYALAWQSDGQVIIGGAFANFNDTPSGGIACLNWDGSLDTTNFFVGTGANDIVWNLNLQPDGTIYVGGQFTEINGTHRLGFARLYSNGTVDTTFMDTAYNQFAGLKKIFADDLEAVYASAVQSDSNVIIGGEFNQVGGGEADTNVCNSLDDELGLQGDESFADPNLWVEPKTRDGVRNRSGVARLIGGSTPGPGNIQMQLSSYSANKNQSSLSVGLVRTNGMLGPISANFSVQQGLAQSGRDYSYDSTPPVFWVASQFTVNETRERSEGLFGVDGSLEDPYGLFLTLADLPINNQSVPTVSVINSTLTSGNLNAQFQLANPSGDNEFYLGGENIPLGSALGASSAPFTVIDNTSQSGMFSFATTNFIVTNSLATISVLRSNGSYGTVTMKCFATNGTAISGTDFQKVSGLSLQFLNGVTSNSFPVTILANGLLSTNFAPKTVNLSLTSLTGGNATFGIATAVLSLINPNFQGYLTLSASSYVGSENSGSISFTVNRVAGSAGQISVQYATTNNTAMSGVNYVGATNSLNWDSGDVSPRTIVLPLINVGSVGGLEQFGVRLYNPTNSAGAAPALFYPGSPGSITNGLLTINNNDSYGTLQFSAPSYLVSPNGGYATLTVVRTGGATGAVSVNYATSDGSNALAGVNYYATNGVLTFAANQTAVSFNVPVLNGGVQNSTNFFFNVTLSNPANASLGSLTNATVNILPSQYTWSPGSTNGLFNSDINGAVLALALQTNGQILAGGDFTSVNGAPQDYIARLNTDGTRDGGFIVSASGPVQAVVCQTDGNVILGGAFTTIDGLVRNNIGRVTTNGFLDTTFNPGAGANGPVYSLAEAFVNNNREIYVGGAFSAISSGPGNNAGSSGNLARLNNNGTLDTTFSTGIGADGAVYAIAVYPTNSLYAGDLLIGGAFAHYQGATVNGIARLTSGGALDSTFNPGQGATNGVVNAIAIQADGEILVGGSFTNFNGAVANNLIRLTANGSTDTAFASNVGLGANNSINAFALQPDNRILVVGQFTEFAGVGRNGVTRLLPSGATDYSINFGLGANGGVNAALVQPANGIITLGGSFTSFNGLPYQHIVQIYGLSTTGSGTFEFSAANYQVTETGIVAPITILRVGGTSGPNPDGTGDVSVNFATITNGSTAQPGTNYLPVSVDVDFPAGSSYETVNVPVLDDTSSTTNSWAVNLLLSNPTPPASLGSQSQYTATLAILNANSAISLLSAYTNVSETVAGGIANIDIVRQGATNNVSSIDFYTTTNGSTGVPGVDYYPTNETITFNPGISLAAAQVLIISNVTPEKTVGILLTNPVNTLLFSPTNGILTINNVNSPGELSFASTNYTVNESAGSVSVTVLRQFGSAGNVFVNYSTVSGTALPGINYQPVTSGTLEIQSGFTSGAITIPIYQNNPPEAPVSFSIVLSGATDNAMLVPPTNTVVTIVDDVNTGVAFLNATNYFLETNATVSVPVQRLGKTNAVFSVQYATTNGTALAGVNYATNSGTLNFAAGQTLAGIPVTLMNDEDVSNLQFEVRLYNPENVQLGAPSNSVVVLQPAGAGLAFTTSATNVYKNAGSITIPVVCLNPAAEPVMVNSNSVPLSVNYKTVNGTAQAGLDYSAVSGTLVFTNGNGTNLVTVPILNNSLITGLRTFSLSLFSAIPAPPAALVAPSNELVTIIDSNSGIGFSSPNYSLFNGGIANIRVLRVDNTNAVSSVAYATVGGGTAVPGSDYYPTNGMLTFTNGQTSASFSVTVIGSSAAAPNKTIVLQLSNPTNAVLMAPSAATLTVYNENGSYVVPAGVALVPGSANYPANGILQPGQPATLSFAFRDAGGTNVLNLMATLLAANGVTSPNPSTPQSYGELIVNGPSVSRPFTLTPVGTNGQPILATFALQDVVGNTTNNIGTNTFTLTLGTWSTTFSNTNAIVFSLMPPQLPPAIASPYPSIITVSNVGGVLVGTTVTLTNLNAQSPEALGVLVVSPEQQDTLIMGNVGSPNAGQYDLTLDFSDTAANYLPSVTITNSSGTNVVIPIPSGFYKPTQNGQIPYNFP